VLLLALWAVAATAAVIVLLVRSRPPREPLPPRIRDRDEARHQVDSIVLENIDEIIFRVHSARQGAVLAFVSPRVTDLLGYTPDEMIGLGNTVIHPDDLENVRAKTREAFRSSATTTFQYRIRHRDGSYRWFENRLRGIGAQGTDGPTVFGVARDITGGKELESDRRRDEEDAQQAYKMEALGRLAGGIAHDFNNLLTTIGGNASFVLELIPPGDTKREALEDILAACDRAARFTRQLLAFSRKQVLQPEPLQIGNVIGDMQQMLARLLGPEYELHVELAAGLPPVPSDRGQMEQVVMNLVVNARDAMPAGGPIAVRTRLATAGDEEAIGRMPSRPVQAVVLEVADRGSGIPDDIRERIFEPFFTTKERGKGTGLGLAMVYGFVRQSGGHVELVSSAETGTTFKIYLPAIAAAHPPIALTIPADPVEGRALTVLVVDDEPAVRHLASAMLRRSGHTVLEASDGAEGERIAGEHTGDLDVLLTDIVMPGIRGPELATRVRGRRPVVRVVYMSGYRDTEALADVERGEAVFLAKPFLRAALLEAITRVGTSA
jgi:two-component system cell cycle sensor histidine kinase/response regulator CckA